MGSKTNIAETLALRQAESDLSLIPESYGWEMFETIKEEVTYSITGKIIAAERRQNEQGQTYDWVQFCFEMTSPEKVLSARSIITWQYTRNTL